MEDQTADHRVDEERVDPQETIALVAIAKRLERLDEIEKKLDRLMPLADLMAEVASGNGLNLSSLLGGLFSKKGG